MFSLRSIFSFSIIHLFESLFQTDSPDGNKTTIVFEDGVVQKIVTENGYGEVGVLQYDQTADGTLLVEIYSPDEGISEVVELEVPEGEPPTDPTPDPPTQDPPAQDPPAQDPPAQDPPAYTPDPPPGTHTVHINVYQCGELVDPLHIDANYRIESSGSTIDAYPYQIGTGLYQVNLPWVEDPPASEVIIDSACNALNAAMNYVCPLVSCEYVAVMLVGPLKPLLALLKLSFFFFSTHPESAYNAGLGPMAPMWAVFSCDALAVGVLAATKNPAIAVAFSNVCVPGYAAASAYCYSGEGDAGSVEGSVGHAVCQALADEAGRVEDFVVNDEVVVYAEAYYADGDVRIGTSTFDPETTQFGPVIVLESDGGPSCRCCLTGEKCCGR